MGLYTVYEEKVLRSVVSKTFQSRQDDRKLQKEIARDETIVSKYDLIVTAYPFYCLRCRQDFITEARKVTNRVKSEKVYAFYLGNHDCGQECVRWITSKADDEYYNLSDVIREQRQTHEDDTLSPQFGRFKVLYGDDYDEQRAQLNLDVEQTLWDRNKLEGSMSYRPVAIKRHRQEYT